MMDKFRLFIAIEAPDEVKNALRALQDKLRGAVSKDAVRWTRSEQMHLTLRFLGEVQSGDVESLTAAVKRVCAGSGTLSLRAQGMGFFPSERAPRVIWTGVSGDLERLFALAKSISEASAPYTTEPAEKSFHPHLTLGRSKTISRKEARALAECAVKMEGTAFGSWVTDSVVIVRSELSSGGSRHSTLAKIPL